MAVSRDAVDSQKEKDRPPWLDLPLYSSNVLFKRSSEFSPDPLTEVIRAGARHLLGVEVQAEVSAFIAEHAHLLNEAGR